MGDNRLEHCEIEECVAPSGYLVSKGFNIRNVCATCMSEMLALYGWSLATPSVEITDDSRRWVRADLASAR